MPFAVKILFYKEGEKVAKKDFEPFWWNIKELKEKYEFREEIDMGYWDFYLDVDITQLKKIHDQQMKYAKAKEKNALFIDKKINQLNRLIETASLYQRFVIWIYEWESGMG